jgi:uncharacterized protein
VAILSRQRLMRARPGLEASGVTLDHGVHGAPHEIGTEYSHPERALRLPDQLLRRDPLQSADLSATGLRHDRSWMLVDETGEFMSQRAHPRMALISIRFSAEHLIVSAPGMEELEIPLYPQAESSIDVRVWGDTNRGELVTEEANRWFTEFLKFPCRLVHKPEDDPRLVDSSFAESGDQVGFADGFAFLLISEASLEDLNMRLEDPLPMNRFRPNFVVRGCGPYAEDGWSRLRIGSVPFRVAEPCPRCAITTVDQETGTRGKEPLRTLATYRKFEGEVFFGRNLIHDTLGTVSVGASVEATPR